MTLHPDLPLDALSPALLWASLDPDARRDAALSIYNHEWDDNEFRDELDEAIASALRFRKVMVRKLPFKKRADYVARSVHPDEGLASTLLLALHLSDRRPLLCAFLDHLEIEHDDGVIGEDDWEPPSETALSAGIERLLSEFPRDHVELYLATLLAMDPDRWRALGERLARLREAEPGG
jgi:hypothetical protein